MHNILYILNLSGFVSVLLYQNTQSWWHSHFSQQNHFKQNKTKRPYSIIYVEKLIMATIKTDFFLPLYDYTQNTHMNNGFYLLRR